MTTWTRAYGLLWHRRRRLLFFCAPRQRK